MNPYPKVHALEKRKRPSVLPFPFPVPLTAPKFIPTKRTVGFYWDRFSKSFFWKGLKDYHSTEFKYKKGKNCITINELNVDVNIGFPLVKEAIKTNKVLHIQLQCNKNSVPLPKWFGHNCNFKSILKSMLKSSIRAIV